MKVQYWRALLSVGLFALSLKVFLTCNDKTTAYILETLTKNMSQHRDILDFFRESREFIDSLEAEVVKKRLSVVGR